MARTRYRYNPETKQLEEVGAEWTGAERRAPVATEELVYGGLQATDGADISSRRKHREYLQANGLAMAGDFRECGPRLEQQRIQRLTGQADSRERREVIGRALYNQRMGRK